LHFSTFHFSAVKLTDKIALWAVAFATLLLSACNLLGPRYKRPDIPAPAAWNVNTTQTPAESAAATAATDAIATTRNGPPSKPSSSPPGQDARAMHPAAPPATAAGTVAAWPSAEWWRGFGSPQLDDLIAQAQQANDDLGAAVARVRRSEPAP